MQRPLFFFLSAALLVVVPGRNSHAGTIVQMAPKAPSGIVSTLSVSDAAPAGWKYLPGVDLYIVDDDGQRLLNDLKKEGAIEAAEESSDIQVEALPDDPMLDDQGWVGGSGLDVGADLAWEITTGSAGVTVAIIDTGISLDHPDLAPNLWTNEGEVPGNGLDDDGNGFVDDVYGYNFWDGNADATDENNHGSHLAGIIGGVGDNGVGIAGVSWRARLMPLRFTDSHGSGTSSRAIEAIDYAIRNGANIINASWTLKLDGASGPGNDSLLYKAILKASEAGILFVTASGNQFGTGVGLNIESSPVYPSSFDLSNIVSVAALNSSGSLAGYSNYGQVSVDLAAPGSSIVSTAAFGRYAAMTGTSIATAVVSGAAALVLSVRPDLTPQQVKGVLEESVVPIDSLSDTTSSGGSLNLYNAVALTQSGSIPDPPPAPTSTTPAVSEGLGFSSGGGCSLIPEK